MNLVSVSDFDVATLGAVSVPGISARADLVTADIQPSATMSAITVNRNAIPITMTQSGLRIWYHFLGPSSFAASRGSVAAGSSGVCGAVKWALAEERR